MRLGVELGEVLIHGSTESNNGVLVVSGVMENISTNEHGVLWDTGWGLGLPEDLSGLGKNLESNVVHDGHVHFWSLVSSTSATASVVASTSSTFLSWVAHNNGVMLDNRIENTQVRKGVLFDVGVELAALVIDEEHDELKVWVVLQHFSNLKLEIFIETLWMKPLPNWFGNGDTKVFGSLRKLKDKFVDGIVRFLIFSTEGGVDASPVLELDAFFFDLFDLEKSITDGGFLSFGSDNFWWVKSNSIGGWV